MIIDVHQHWEPEFLLGVFIPFICRFIQDMYVDTHVDPVPDLDEIIKEYTWLTDDPDGSRIVEHMDMNGVDKSVVF